METDLRQARHNLRGRINALKLCISAFEILDTREEVLEFLEMTDQAADRTVAALDALESVMEGAAPAANGDDNDAPASSSSSPARA
jgi:hypothetical protein